MNKVKGIYFDSSSKKWEVKQRIGGSVVNYGRFVDFEDAYYLRVAINQCLGVESPKCTICGGLLPLTSRVSRKYCSDKCKRKGYSEHPSHSKVYDISNYNRNTKYKMYGITKDIYLEMLSSQDNKCLICKKEMSSPEIDHCHNTGKVRGLLCKHCNIGLGYFKDSKQFLKSAIDYLESSI